MATVSFLIFGALPLIYIWSNFFLTSGRKTDADRLESEQLLKQEANQMDVNHQNR